MTTARQTTASSHAVQREKGFGKGQTPESQARPVVAIGGRHVHATAMRNDGEMGQQDTNATSHVVRVT